MVLAYHEIAEPSQAVIADYAVTPAAFQAQMAWLVAHGHHFVSVHQVLAAGRGGRPLPLRPVPPRLSRPSGARHGGGGMES